MTVCYTYVLTATWGFLFLFYVLKGAWVLCHWGLCGVHVEVIILLRVLVIIICPLLGPLFEVEQGLFLVLPLEYAPLEVMSLVEGRLC